MGSGTAVSIHGLAVFFIEFLHTSGLWAALRDRCPLHRTSPNAPDLATVVGSLLLTVLFGGSRYRHVDHICGDQVSPVDVEARPDNESHAVHGASALWDLLDNRLSSESQPWCIRGDISYGNEKNISGCESRGCDYLFKIQRSAGIKALLHELEDTSFQEQWTNAGHGWQGYERTLQLTTWSSSRRVVVVRRLHTKENAATRIPHKEAHQQHIFVAELCPDDGFEYAVLVTSLPHPIATISRFLLASGFHDFHPVLCKH